MRSYPFTEYRAEVSWDMWHRLQMGERIPLFLSLQTNPIVARLGYIWFVAVSRFRIWYCDRVLNHPGLRDDGWGNPDSGCIDVHCTRCGWSAGRKWLY